MWVDPWGLCKHDLDDTRSIVRSIRRNWNPLLHGVPSIEIGPVTIGGYDYNISRDTFTIMQNGKEVTLSGAEFANYLAGYMGRFHLGKGGGWLMHRVGDWYAGVAKGGSETRYFKPHFGADDPESRRDIDRGIRDAKKDKWTWSGILDRYYYTVRKLN